MNWPDYISVEDMDMQRKEWMLSGYVIRQWTGKGGWKALEAQDPINAMGPLYVCEGWPQVPAATYRYFSIKEGIGVWERDLP